MPMPAKVRFLVGAVAGLIPTLLTLLAVEGGTLFSDVAPATVAGYAVQAAVVAGLGGFVAWMYDDITDKIVLAQIGIAAPSILKGLVSAGGAFALGTQLWVTTPLLAAQQAQQLEVPRETATQQFFRGLLGVKPQLREYLVEVYDHDDRDNAAERLRELQQQFPEFQFQLFEPKAGLTDEWVVAIEGPVTKKQADRILRGANSEGVPGLELRTIVAK